MVKLAEGSFDLFMQRHQDEIRPRPLIRTSGSRALGFTKENVSKFFTVLEEIHEKHHNDVTRIFNVNESGLSIVQSKLPSHAMKSKR